MKSIKTMKTALLVSATIAAGGLSSPAFGYPPGPWNMDECERRVVNSCISDPSPHPDFDTCYNARMEEICAYPDPYPWDRPPEP